MFVFNQCKSGPWFYTIYHSVFLDHFRVAEVVPEVADVINRGRSGNKML